LKNDSQKQGVKGGTLAAGLILMGLWVLTGCATIVQAGRSNTITLYFEAGSAASVEFACSLDQFKPRPMQKAGGGKWSIRVPDSRYFTYYYMVDGEVRIPDCRLKEADDFGSVNCIHEPAPGVTE